ncbi:MAG: ATP-binding cassette domain-containing protein [Pseudomonadota bacterium]
MSLHTYQLKRGKALVIVGPQGCGKSILSQAIANRHGSMQTIRTGPDWEFSLRDALNGKVQVLIVDGVPSQAEMADIKCMVIQPQILYFSVESKRPESYPSPLIIITAPDTDWMHEGTRRFDVIDMSKAVGHV